METVFRCVISGAPRTKKNHGRVINRMRNGSVQRFHVPSEAHEKWYQLALPQVNVARARGAGFPLKCPLNCRAIFYRESAAGDAVGYYQALADLLQAARVVDDDKYIESWDGTRLAKDASRPRIEVVLEKIVDVRQAKLDLEDGCQ